MFWVPGGTELLTSSPAAMSPSRWPSAPPRTRVRRTGWCPAEGRRSSSQRLRERASKVTPSADDDISEAEPFGQLTQLGRQLIRRLGRRTGLGKCTLHPQYAGLPVALEVDPRNQRIT